MKKLISKKSFAVASLRRASYRWPAREQARREAKVDRNQYRCNGCKGIFKRKDTKLDHIDPVVGKEGFTTFDDFIERLLCEVENFQVLCHKCHTEKTNKENQERREWKKKSK